jgi:hypothetical protein
MKILQISLTIMFQMIESRVKFDNPSPPPAKKIVVSLYFRLLSILLNYIYSEVVILLRRK